MFTLIGYDARELILPNSYVYTFMLSTLAVTIVFYLLRSIAIYTMSKGQNLKCAWVSWIPFVWVYVVCKMLGKTRLFGRAFEKWAWLFALVYSVGQILTLVYNGIIYFPVIGNFLHGNDLYIVLISDSKLLNEYAQSLKVIWGNFHIYGGANYVDPFPAMGIYPEVLAPIFNVVSFLSTTLDLACTFIIIMLYVHIFRRYWPEHFILASVLSWLGIFAPLVFAIRKRKPVDYAEYLRSRFNNMYANGNPYGGNPYGNYNANQNGNAYTQRQTPPDPFSEFSNKKDGDPGDPFEEFSNKDRK